MRKIFTFMVTLLVAIVGLTAMAQAPQTGVYRIQNVGGNDYIQVTGKYDAQLVSSQSEASYITVGIEKKLSDGTYKVNSLYSTYDGGEVEVYDYLTKALTLGEIELRRELEGSSGENVQTAINRMHELAQEYGFMRMMPVDGQADTYHAIAVLPTIPSDIVEVWQAKKNPNNDYESEITHGNTMWDWCIDIVYRYLDEHSGEGGTNAALAAKIRNNLANIQEGYTYMLTEDTDGSFGYIETGKNIKDPVTGETTVNPATLTSDNNRSYWKLTPKVNNENVKDGTYKIRNIGQKTYVRIRGRYYATPDAEESAASDIRITFDDKANGGQKIINLGGKYGDTDIDIYKYIEKAIFIGKMAIYDVLTEGTEANPASGGNIEYAQEYFETEVKNAAFMCIKPVEGNDEAVYAYFTLPHIPEEAIYQMAQHGAIDPDNPTEKAAWEFGVGKVMQYLQQHSGQGGTDNTLASYITANIGKLRPGVTYYLGAENNGTFDYYPKFENPDEGWSTRSNENIIDKFDDIKANIDYQWGFDVKDVEEDNLTSGTYKVRNVETGDYVEVLSKYYAKPDTTEAGATEIHITYSGKLDDGSYKVTNMSAVAKDGSMCDIQSYVDKAIKLGKIAIADALKDMSDPEDIAYAQQYMEDFIRAAAFMRVKPVVGTNYVYAIATIPEIPYEVYHEMYRHGVIEHDTKEDAWDYGVQVVQDYLGSHNTDGTLAQLINNLINDSGIIQGHTYYLKEDANKTFGYVDAANFSADDKTIQWGIDLEEEDQPVESDFYKIHNVGNDKYVKVYDRYYAKPDVDEANATPIAVTIDGMLEDGSMKVTNLVGDGRNIQSYVDHAIELGNALIDQLLAGENSQYGPSDPDNIARAKAAMESFIRENAYMRVKLVPGETDAYYAYVTLPTVPDSIVTEWRKKVPESVFPGSMRDWAVQQVLNYLNNHPQVDNTLAAMVRANINRLYEGHTYYLRADGDGTFGFADATLNEMDFSNSKAAQHYWWGFADAIKAEPVSGYFRVKGADGKYVNVTGKFAATPNLDATAAKTAAGSVIYIGTGETKNTKTLPLDTLRSQGVDVGQYMTMLNDVLGVVAGTAIQVATEKLEDSNYSQYAGLVEPLAQTLLESVDLNLYVEPTLTSDGKEAYMLEVNIPDLAEYCDLALDALELMGKTQADLVRKLGELEAEAQGTMKTLLGIAKRAAQYLDDPDTMWEKLKENAIPYVQTYFIDNSYDEQLGVSGGVMSQVGQFILNALNNPDFNYGTTYCLRQDADGTFGYASRESLADVDDGKWILEPFDEQDPNYDAENYIPFVVSTDFTQETYTNEQNVGVTNVGPSYNFTTTYLDFDAKIETQNVKAYKVSSTERVESYVKENGQVVRTNVYYIAHLEDVDVTNGIPAATPVVLRSDEGDTEIQLRPINKPEHPAVESGELEAVKDKIIELFQNKVNGMTTQGAPSPRAISEATNDSPLVGSYFNEEVDASDANIYMPLASKTKREDDSFALDMEGLGFWKDGITELEGNKAYMYGVGQEEFMPRETFEQGTVGSAPGYIFQYPDGDNTFTRIENVSTIKEVKSVRYYNTLGVESNTPFDGVNVIVTTFTDGTRSTVKVIK